MSSFIGHSLAAATIYAAGSSQRRHRSRLWMGWLIIIALVPDLDYAIPALQASHHNGLRITHSILVSLLLPIGTGLWMMTRGAAIGKPARRWRVMQMTFAGLSHLIMDLFVGVTPLPLLWPLVLIPFKLSFGLLPSAGRLQLSNALMYHNLGIELGVMVPGSMLVLLLIQRKGHPILLTGLGLMSCSFMIWAAQLSR